LLRGDVRWVGKCSHPFGSQKAAELRRISGTLDLGGIDRAGPKLEEVLWMSVRDDPPPAELQRRLQQPATSTDPG
jgi:hypothetical protein